MSDKVYKINEPIKVVFQALGGQTGIIDLSMLVTDPSGNDSSPVTLTELSNGLYESEFTPDEAGRWWVKISSVAYPENGSKTSYLVGYQEGANNVVIIDSNGNPSTTDFATESTSTAIKNTIGEESGNTVLSKLQNIWDKLTSLFTDGLAKIKIWDGTNIVTTTVEGEKKRLDVQVAGTVSISSEASSIPLQVAYQKAFSAINTNEWQEVATYTVPAGYKFTISSFQSFSQTAGETARVYIEKEAGTFDCPTNTFTDGEIFTYPQFGTGLYVYVTTTIASTVDDIITITYTNQLGVTGRTCTITIPKGSAIGTSLPGVLQGNDLGVIDVTNVTHSATGQAGAFKVDLYFEIFNLLMTSSNVLYQAVSISGNAVTLETGSEIVLAVLAGTKTVYTRRLSLFGTLDVI